MDVPDSFHVLYKLYGYGLRKGKPTPKIAVNKVQETIHFRYVKFLLTKELTGAEIDFDITVPTKMRQVPKLMLRVWYICLYIYTIKINQMQI